MSEALSTSASAACRLLLLLLRALRLVRFVFLHELVVSRLDLEEVVGARHDLRALLNRLELLARADLALDLRTMSLGKLHNEGKQEESSRGKEG